MEIPISKFHRTKEELRKLAEENNIKLLKLLKCLRRREKLKKNEK